MGELVKAAIAGHDSSVLPAVQYNYAGGIAVPIGNASTASAALVPKGLYRLSVDVACHVTFAAAPAATRGGAESFYLPAGAMIHEVMDGTTKVAAINAVDGETGNLRLHPAVEVE